MIAPGNNSDNVQLIAAIAHEIRNAPNQLITFERFMEMALYYPGEGYYTHRVGLIGARGDFFTSPHLSPVFGELIGKQIAEFWERQGRPSSFEIVEIGAGQGLLAGDILSSQRKNNPAFWQALSYTMVEVSESLRLGQRRRLEALPDGAELLAKTRWRSLEDFKPGEVTGCFLSNELLDAFPVHLIEVDQGNLYEIYVKLDEDKSGFEEERGPLSNPAITTYFEKVGLNLHEYADGYRTEVNLRALQWLEKVAESLHQGYVLTIDYGYPAAQRYHPLRSSGTLQCYFQHQVHADPYINIGRQDMTVHVDFTSLMQRGKELGLDNIGFTRQALFLASLGLGDKLAEMSNPNYREQAGITTRQLLAEREALQRLLNPSGLGNFGVLIQAKNVPASEKPLTGLALTL
ncbi:MAG TPA: class I SAM-dependent methyltransferase [Chloroflexia bacterium]|nr:class I SAM-dependent methyltransferase [Chloroflexia bacterium]